MQPWIDRRVKRILEGFNVVTYWGTHVLSLYIILLFEFIVLFDYTHNLFSIRHCLPNIMIKVFQYP